MSAFIVDYKTIDNVLSIRLNPDILAKCSYLKSEYDSIINFSDWAIYEGLTKLGKEFLRLNCLSVGYCYDELNKDDLDYYGLYIAKYKFNDSKPTIKQAIKSIQCLMYQSCEIENYKENETFQKMEKLKNYLIDALLYIDEEYQKAKWSDTYEVA